MFCKLNTLINLVVFLCLVSENASKFEWTNFKCTSVDSSFSTIEYCYIKPINRTYKYLSFKAKLLKTPVTKVKINFALYKRLNGYVPFLYNMTVDSCRFLKNTNSQPISKYFYELIMSNSNMNHTCPYDHDLIIDKLSTSFVNNRMTEVLPFPEGRYLLQTHWYAYDILRAKIGFYGTVS